MRRRTGEAAELIVRALADTGSPALTLAELEERTGLPNATIHDNVKALRKVGKIEASKDGHGTLWLSLCDDDGSAQS
jgi:DNA-binding IclR family transcriptional regulator